MADDDPDQPNAVAEQFNDQGNEFYDEGDLDAALDAYSKALEAWPKYSWAYCNRAAVHLAMENTEGAINDYTEAIKIDDTDSALFNGRGFAYMTLSPPDLEHALADVDMAIKLEEVNGAAHCTRGALLKTLAEREEQGSPKWTQLIDDAIKHERRAIELEPEADEPRKYLQDLLKMQGITDDSVGRSSMALDGPAPARPDTMPKGLLSKKGGLKDGERNWMKGGRRNWKQRWFCFSDVSTIQWLEEEGGKELGTLILSDCRLECSVAEPLKFCVRAPARDLWLKADDQATSDAWMAAIRSCTGEK